MKKLFFLVTAILVICAVGLVQPVAAETLRVGCECTYFPFNYRGDDGVLAGYDIDVATGIAKRIGADIEFVCQKWDGMIAALLANKFDLVAASMSITEKRLKKMSFSIPYRVSVGRFVGKTDANFNLFDGDGNPNPANFKGVTVGLERATTYHNWITAYVPDAKVLLYDTNEALYLDLQNGRTDVIMTNPMKAFLKFLSKERGKGFGFLSPQLDEPSIFGIGVGIGIAKGREELLGRIDKALATMIKDGTLKKYALRYFPFAIHNENWEAKDAS
ncbi:MAG: transporter substrate-binding domain-containing protein [Deltaproteobacteria bacterium]|nr:transporter substrate-binding domain-containing protein [Deltaproteobacteria bacterium]